MNIRTITADYEATHGKLPKGEGNWTLELTGTDCQGRFMKETYSEFGLLSTAKNAACRRMKQEVGGVKAVIQIKVLA